MSGSLLSSRHKTRQKDSLPDKGFIVFICLIFQWEESSGNPSRSVCKIGSSNRVISSNGAWVDLVFVISSFCMYFWTVFSSASTLSRLLSHQSM